MLLALRSQVTPKAIAVVGDTIGAAVNGTTSMSLTRNGVKANSLLVIQASVYVAPTATISIRDNRGSTYTPVFLVQSLTNTNQNIAQWYLNNTKAGTYVITISTAPTVGNFNMVLTEIC